MKNIQELLIWHKGSNLNAKILDAYLINDNLKDSAKFCYSLYTQNQNSNTKGVCLCEGNLTMNGEDYINWNTSNDINEQAFIWIAEQLGLIII